MKRLLLIVLPLLLIVGCSSPEPINYEEVLNYRDGVYYTKDTNKPYSGPVFSLDKYGRIKRESNLEDGKMISYMEITRNNVGEKKEESYKNGKMDGLQTQWYENGQKESEESYKDGEKDGLSTEWDENGQKRGEGKYKMDYGLDGLWTWWYENGQKSSSGNFIHSTQNPDGLWTWWYENGQKKCEKTFKDGIVIEVIGRWNEDGSVRKEPFDWE